MAASRISHTSPGWRVWLPAVLVAFIASRALLLAVAWIVDASLPLGFERLLYAPGHPLGGLTGLDAVYYLGIAADGYHAAPVNGVYQDWVFFPAYPLLVRAMSLLTMGDVVVAGLLASNLAFLAALIAVALLVRASAGDEVAGRTALLLSLAPGAVAFGLPYSDSLWILTAAGVLLAVRAGRWWLVAGLYAVAALSRPPGILLAIPIAIALVEAGGRRISRTWMTLAAGPVALAAFAAYQGATLGDPLAFVHGQDAWQIPSIVGGGQTPEQAALVTSILPLVLLMLAALLAYTAILPRLRRAGIPWSQVAVAVIAFASVFASGRLQSDARYLAVAWPFAWYLAAQPSARREVVLAVAAGGYVLFAFLNLTHVLAA